MDDAGGQKTNRIYFSLDVVGVDKKKVDFPPRQFEHYKKAE